MLNGSEFLESLRDGRRVYVGRERVADVTGHPAFRNAAGTFATIYDRRREDANRDLMVSEEDGETFATYFLRPRSRRDLERRCETHRRIASWSYGLIGRSPDNFPSYLSGLATCPDLFDGLREGCGANLLAYYRRARRDDLFVTHTVTNPQTTRRPQAFSGSGAPSPTLRVVDEDDAGVVVNGLKMIGTSAVFCHDAWVGNLQPVPEGRGDETITCAVPLAAPGVSIWARKPYERFAGSEFDMPLTWRFDETDAAVLFENVRVPWENVFLHDDVGMTREIYMRTPGHALANHQANVRFLEKLKLLVGVAHAVCKANDTVGIPAVQAVLGDLAAGLALLEGLVTGQVQGCEEMVPGYVTVNRRYMYAALHWCTTRHSAICDTVRELLGGGPIQMPADSSVLADPALRDRFETYWSTPQQSARDRMKLMRLAWDLLSSEFAGRNAQYEKFYAGPGFVMNSYSFENCPWPELDGIVDGLLAGYDADAGGQTAPAAARPAGRPA